MRSVNIGNNHIRQGETVQIDHSIRTFVVQVRTMSSVGPETIKNLIEQKFEVVDCQQTDQTNFVRKL